MSYYIEEVKFVVSFSIFLILKKQHSQKTASHTVIWHKKRHVKILETNCKKPLLFYDQKRGFTYRGNKFKTYWYNAFHKSIMPTNRKHVFVKGGY